MADRPDLPAPDPGNLLAARLTADLFAIKYSRLAEVAELADALRSGRSEGSLMWVQVPPSALQRGSWDWVVLLLQTKFDGRYQRPVLFLWRPRSTFHRRHQTR